MPETYTLGIIGLGLIGGALARQFKKLGLGSIVALSPQEDLDLALKDGIIDVGSDTDYSIFRHCDYVIIATPIQAIVPCARAVIPYLAPSAILTDVGSIKEPFYNTLSDIAPNYVSSHPMFGSESTGYTASGNLSITHQLCYLIPPRHASEHLLLQLIRFWNQLGLKVRIISFQHHDHTLAYTSHLPQALSSLLAQTLPPETFKHIGPGCMGMLRLAQSHESIWKDIFHDNPHTLQALNDFRQLLDTFIQALDNEQENVLTQFIQNSRKIKERIDRHAH